MGIVSAGVATGANTATPVPIYICAALYIVMAGVAAVFPYEPMGRRSSWACVVWLSSGLERNESEEIGGITWSWFLLLGDLVMGYAGLRHRPSNACIKDHCEERSNASRRDSPPNSSGVLLSKKAKLLFTMVVMMSLSF
jgi:hypothetical protein